MDQQARGRTRVSGEIVPFGKLFAALSTLKRRDRISELDVMVYEDRTAHIPLNVLSRAVTKWIDTEEWFPTVAELLEACEQVRLEMRGALSYDGCADCETSKGWISIGRDVRRCPCWGRHQAKVAALGAGDQPLALPAVPRDFTQVGE